MIIAAAQAAEAHEFIMSLISERSIT